MSNRITVVSPQGESFEIDNTKENLEKAIAANYTVDKSLLSDIGDIGKDFATGNMGLVPGIIKSAIKGADYAPSQLPKKEKESIGLLEPGNIDLQHRPVAKNEDGSISTVRSLGVNIDGKEVLIPTVSDDGKILSDNEAIDLYKKTGKHLGIFSDPRSSSLYADQLHKDQEKLYSKKEEYNPQTDPEMQGLRGQAETAVRAGQREFAMGALDPFLQKEELEKSEKLEEENPGSALAGKAVGFIANLAATAGPVSAVGKMAEGMALGREAVVNGTKLSLTKQLIGNAAKYAAEGAIYSTPQAATQLAYGDPETAAETMLWGTLGSGALGIGGKLLSTGAKAGLSKATPSISDLLSNKQANGVSYLDDISRNILGISDKQAKKLGPAKLAQIVEMADKEGLLSASPKERPKLIQELKKDAGLKIGEHQTKLEELLDDIDIKKLGPIPLETASKFQTEVQKLPGIMTETHSEQLKLANKIYADILAGGNEPSFKKLQQIRDAIKAGKKAFLRDTPQAELFRFADNIIKQDLEASAQKIYNAGELPEQFADYLTQKSRYETGSVLSENLNPFKGTGRLALPFGSLVKAGVVGHFLGGPAGFGAELALEAFLKNKGGLLGKSASFLRKSVENPEIGGLMAKAGNEALQGHLDKIPSIISGSSVVAKSAAALNPFSHILGDVVGLSREQQYNKLTDKIEQASVDMDLTAQKIGHIASSFSGTDINLSSLVAQKQLQALSYLQSQIPKNPNPPSAFQKDDWKPSKQEQQEFLHKVSIVNDPMVVWAHYQNKTLDSIDRDTLKAVYPKIYEQMVQKILTTAYDPRTPKLNHHDRMQLSMFTGVPLDDSLKNIAAIQQSITSQSVQPQEPKSTGRASAHPKFKFPSLATDTQKRENRIK